jgi:NAD(P)-dependent dehydrogenase (short-subunit alcohol dehydrogenase family)
VTASASVEAAVAAARERNGPARIAVYCAGIGTAGRIVGRYAPMPLDALRRVIEVNLIGSFNIMRLAAAEMSNLEPLDEGDRGIPNRLSRPEESGALVLHLRRNAMINAR